MPLFIAALIGGLISAAGSFIGQALISLGVGYVAYQGVDTSIMWAKDFALQQFANLPPQAMQIAGSLQLGRCISILTSALVARMVLQGLKSGTLKKFTVK